MAAGPFDKQRIYFHIILRHARSIEALFESPPARVAAQARNLAHGFNGFIDRVHDKPGLAVCKHLRYRTIVPSNHWRAAGQRLYHDQAEGLRPIDGKEEGIGVAYQFIFVFAADNTETVRAPFTSIEGKWDINAHTFHLEDEKVIYTFQRTGHKLTLGQPPDGKRMDTYLPDPIM